MVREDTEVGLAGSPVLAWLWPSPGLHVSVPACNTGAHRLHAFLINTAVANWGLTRSYLETPSAHPKSSKL